MNFSQYENYELKKLCHLLGFDKNKIVRLLTSIETNYREWKDTKLDGNGQPKTYLDGTVKTRTFRNPSALLKAVQQRIRTNILDRHPLPNFIHGGIKRKSNITNAKPHQGKKYFLKTDLQNFYPNIGSSQVLDFFKNLGYSGVTAKWLTTLTTVKNELPQGSPTSPRIANFVFLQTDYELLKICQVNEITYTRYVDDLTFSSPKIFHQLIPQILNTIKNDGFKISWRKTTCENTSPVTGVHIFLNKIDAPTYIIENAKKEVSLQTKYKPYCNYLNTIRKTNNYNEQSKPAKHGVASPNNEIHA